MDLAFVAECLRAADGVRDAFVLSLDSPSGAALGAVIECDPGVDVQLVRQQPADVAVEQIGTSQDGRNLLIARGRDVLSGWRISFVVPPVDRDRVLNEVRAGRRPRVSVPEMNALPWASVSRVAWE